MVIDVVWDDSHSLRYIYHSVSTGIDYSLECRNLFHEVLDRSGSSLATITKVLQSVQRNARIGFFILMDLLIEGASEKSSTAPYVPVPRLLVRLKEQLIATHERDVLTLLVCNYLVLHHVQHEAIDHGCVLVGRHDGVLCCSVSLSSSMLPDAMQQLRHLDPRK